MIDYLVFRLSATLGSMGGYAGNERRGSDRWPARSAVMGLIAGALGIDRADTQSILQLQSNFKLGIALQQLGPSLGDFHTAQTVPSAAAKQPDSRHEAFATADPRKLMTVLSQRNYYEECCFDIGITASVGNAELEKIQGALKNPHFAPYFGRKACPLDQPMHPVIINAEDILQAFEKYQALESHTGFNYSHTSDIVASLDPDLLPPDHVAYTTGTKVERRDRIIDRQHWSFATGISIRVQQKRRTN